jgi:diguanylate cyclase (GGDEF)-like protein
MDPVTVFIVAAAMMLLNGGVLGLVHRGLPEYLRPSAVSWRIGTLLMAGGSILLALQMHLPAAFVLPLANGFLMLGLARYWRGLRFFYGQHDTFWLLLPVVFGVAGIYWFAAVVPNLGYRVLVASVVWVTYAAGCIWTLMTHAREDRSLSRRVMMGIFFALIILFVARMTFFSLNPTAASTLVDSGSWMNALTPLLAAVVPVIGTTTFLQMCSERIRHQWETAASTDYLTGLANRRQLVAAGERLMLEARTQKQPLAVAVIDIDHFKAINDRYGHDVGDQAIQHVANRLRQGCRSQDLLIRQGGEEFVVLLDGMSSVQAIEFAERMLDVVRAVAFVSNGSTQKVTVSIGVTSLLPTDHQLDDILRRADQALYAAKADGRDRARSG